MIALYNYLRTDHHYLSDRFEQVNPIRLTLERLGILPPPPPSPNRRQVNGAWVHLESFLFFFLLYFTELFPRLENKTWINQTKIRRPHPIQHSRMDGETKISPHKTARHRLAGYNKSLALSEKLSSTQRRYGSSSKKSSRKQRCYKGQGRISGNKARSRCTSILLSRTAGSPLRR